MDVAAVLAQLGPRAVASHEIAAQLWGLALVVPGRNRITVPRDRSRTRVAGWRLHRSDLPPDEVVVRNGVRVTSVVRTVVDLAAVLPLDEAVAAADSAVRLRLVTLAQLVAGLRARRGRGAAAPRAVASLVRPDSGSALESLLRVLLVQAGLPPPETQVLICEPDGQFVARVNFCWRQARLVVEADGFGFHSNRAAYRRDRERLNALERLGWRVLRFSWEDVRHWKHHVAATVTACLYSAAALPSASASGRVW